MPITTLMLLSQHQPDGACIPIPHDSRHLTLADMISTLRIAASRVATRNSSLAFSALRTNTRQPVFAFRHFSAPPAFLDAGEVTDRVLMVVKNFDKVDPAKVSASVKFADDLGLDSLDIVEVVMAIEDEFAIEIPDQEADKISSIQEAVDYIASHPTAK